MKKRYATIFFAFTLSSTVNLNAQIATGDAKGNNSIVLENSKIGIDIAESSIEFSWNNFNSENYRKRRTNFWGFSASGKSEEGIASIWGEGSITPAAKIQGFYAFKVMNDSKLYGLMEAKEKIRKEHEISIGIYKYLTDRQNAAKETIDSFFAGSLAEKKALSEAILKIINGCPACKIDALIKELDKKKVEYTKAAADQEATITAKIEEKIKSYEEISRKYLPSVNDAASKIDSINAQLKKFSEKIPGHKKAKGGYTIFYILGGMTGTSFEMYDATIVDPNLNKRFPETKFRGGFIDLGINKEFSPSLIGGLTAGFEVANTFDSLSKKDYTVRTTDAQGNQSLISEKKHTGYAGFYEKYSRVNIKSDLIKYCHLSEEFDLAWNIFYTRLYLPLSNDKIKSVMNLGTGINFFKKEGQFAGGVYLESNDLFNAVSDMSFGKRLQISLVATFTFKSIVDRFAKPE